MSTMHVETRLTRFLKLCWSNSYNCVLHRNYKRQHTHLCNFSRQLSTTTEHGIEYDVVIAGGGMVGGTMACALGKSQSMQGKKLLLLDAGNCPSTNVLSNVPIYFSNRVCAISPGNIEFFESLNILEKIPRSATVKKMQIWDACSDALICFDKENMSEDLCKIVENFLVIAAITKVLQSEILATVEVKYNSRINTCKFPDFSSTNISNQCVNITLEDGTFLKTKLLIAADGSNSVVVKESKIKQIRWPYDQSAVVATLKLNEPTDNFVAWQRFLPSGPIALLPLTDEFSSLVWSTSHQHAEELVELNENEFVSEVNSAFWKNYSQNEVVGQIKELLQSALPNNMSVMQYPPTIAGLGSKQEKFPLGFAHLGNYVKPGLAVIGDACHRIHPLAGQGVNLGLRDVACLSRILNEAVCNGEHLGSMEHLLNYESERQAANLPIATAVDLLKRLYSTDNPALVALRTCGLTFANAMKPIKDFLMEEAMK